MVHLDCIPVIQVPDSQVRGVGDVCLLEMLLKSLVNALSGNSCVSLTLVSVWAFLNSGTLLGFSRSM